jgi:hypothetical protein
MAFSFAAIAQADIPAGYAGKPFDPKVAGGPKCPPTVVAGPYTIPGRLDFVNYDLGGDGVAYHTGDHITKGGTGYRTDTPTATFSLTSDCIPNGAPGPCQNVWYDTSAALDGTPYPSATTADFSIGAVQDGDWVNITVNVETTGTYSVSSTWATGNGPPGGEGGNGDMGLEVFSNGTKLATWTAVFPNYNTDADFHHWMAYPNFATVALTAGPQVIKLQSGAKHLQLDYVQFSLMTGDGGLDDGDGGTDSGNTASSGAATSGGASGSAGGGGSTATTGSATSGGVQGGSGAVASAGAEPSGSMAETGSTTASGAAGGTTGVTTGGSGSSNVNSNETSGGSHASSCTVSIDGRHVGGEGALAAALALIGVIEARRRRAGRGSQLPASGLS